MGNDYNLNLWQKAQIGLKAAWNSNKSIEELFNKADTNGSGGLDAGEAQALLNSWKLGSIFNIEDVFNDNNENGTIGVDTDKSGEISMEEVITYAKKMGYIWDKDTKLMQALKDVKNGIGSKPGFGLNGDSTSNTVQNMQSASANADSAKKQSGTRIMSDEEVAYTVDRELVDKYCHGYARTESFSDFVHSYYRGSDLTDDDLTAIIKYFNENKNRYPLPPNAST